MKILLGIVAVATVISAADMKVGKPLTLKTPVTVGALLAQADKNVDKTVQVQGKITEVCQAMGCWVDLADENGKRIHLQFEHGAVEFPKDSAGKMAIAEGKLTKTELNHEQALARAEEEAKDTGRKFNPESVKGGMTLYEIQGTGAVIR
jgi:hypothetical protein